MYYYKNEIELKDKNNDTIHELKFDYMEDIYDGELFLIDTRELGYIIINEIESMYNEKPISIHTIELEIETYLLDITNKLRDRIREVSQENNICIDKNF